VGFIGLIYFQKNILPSPLLQREEFPASNLFKRNKKNIKKSRTTRVLLSIITKIAIVIGFFEFPQTKQLP
jgi:hypothetical protein